MSKMAGVFMLLVLLVIIPLQRLSRETT